MAGSAGIDLFPIPQALGNGTADGNLTFNV
jgi:hypothetical protein